MSEQGGGRARSQDDARAWFYLDHRGDIETWVTLRSEGRALLHRCLLEMGPMIDELATELGVEVRDGDLDDGDRPGFGLRRRDWVGPVLAEVAVVVEWQLSALLIPGRGDTWPYVAVRYDAAMDDPAGRRSLEAALADVRKDLDGNASRWWPFWRYVEPADGVVDPDALIEACIEDLRELWAATAPILDSIRTQVVIDEPSD